MPNPVRSDSYLRTLPVLSAARVKAGLTQVELASRMGKPQSFVSKVERGERRLDIAEFCQFADALGLEPSNLLKQVTVALKG